MAQANDSNWWILFNLLSLTELIRIAGFANC
jgi:hypothetical protein